MQALRGLAAVQAVHGVAYMQVLRGPAAVQAVGAAARQCKCWHCQQHAPAIAEGRRSRESKQRHQCGWRRQQWQQWQLLWAGRSGSKALASKPTLYSVHTYLFVVQESFWAWDAGPLTVTVMHIIFEDPPLVVLARIYVLSWLAYTKYA